MTQEQYNQAHIDAMQAINMYASGLILLHELQRLIADIDAPIPNPTEKMQYLVDPATGLSF